MTHKSETRFCDADRCKRNTHVRPYMAWSDFVLEKSDDLRRENVTGYGSLTKQNLYLPWQRYQILQFMIGAKSCQV